jgi:hypothetical protein
MKRIVRALFDRPDDLSAEDVAKSDILKELLKIHIPISIENAIIGKKMYAPLFEINDSGLYIEVHKHHWIQSLETCLVWYVEDEDYEMCNHIKNLIHAVQEKTNNKLSLNKKIKDG